MPAALNLTQGVLRAARNLALSGTIPEGWARIPWAGTAKAEPHLFDEAQTPIWHMALEVWGSTVSGTLPHSLSLLGVNPLVRIGDVHVQSTQLSGTIPPNVIGRLAHDVNHADYVLRFGSFKTDHTLVSGTLPHDFARLDACEHSYLGLEFRLNGNFLSGTLPPLSCLRDLTTLRVDETRLSGTTKRRG